MERTASFINIWFWSRGDSSVPSDVKNGATSVDTSNWVSFVVSAIADSRDTTRITSVECYTPTLTIISQGTPSANFPDTDCDIASHFGPHNIIINLTFCAFFFLCSLFS